MCFSLELHRDGQLPELLVQLWRGLCLELRPRFMTMVSGSATAKDAMQECECGLVPRVAPCVSVG